MADIEAAPQGVWRIVHPTDLVICLILVGGAAALWIVSDNFEEVPDLFSQNLQPDLFPKLLLGCIVALSLTLPFEHLFLPGGRERLDGGRKSPIRLRTVLIGLLTAALLAAMPYLGAIVSLFAISLISPLFWGERRLLAVLGYAILFPTAVITLFGVLLKVHLDPGRLGVGLY